MPRATKRYAVLLAASVMAWGSGASAAPSCQGTYAATSLQPLPERVVVDLESAIGRRATSRWPIDFSRESVRQGSRSGKTRTCCCT